MVDDAPTTGPDGLRGGGEGSETSTPAVEVRGLKKVYEGGVLAVDGIDFAVEEGEFCVVIGPSGCGKSTTLHSLVGKVEPTAGRIFIGGEEVTETPTYERDIGLVFQDFQLFPHMTVEENVRYGLERLGRVDEAVVEDTLELMNLEESRDRRPEGLSAGQRQRVALARSLVLRPQVLLLDEPLGDMDYKLQRRMEEELLRIHREVETTFIYVTHDQRQAMRMGDQLVVMNEGLIEQSAAAETVYERPATAFVAAFVGDSNIFTGRKVSPDGTPAVETPYGTFRVTPDGVDAADGDEVSCLVRPHLLDIAVDGGRPSRDGRTNRVTGAVVDVVEEPGSGTQVFVEVEGERHDGASGPTRELQLTTWDLPAGVSGGVTATVSWAVADTHLLSRTSVVPGTDIETDILGE